MTLDEALRYAREHQPSLQSARARVAAAAADTRVARAQWLPTFGATVQAFEGTTNNRTASYVGVREVDAPTDRRHAQIRSTGTFTPSTSTLAAVGAGQEVFDFGRIAAQAAVADVGLRDASNTARHASACASSLLVKDAYFARPRRARRPARRGGRLSRARRSTATWPPRRSRAACTRRSS